MCPGMEKVDRTFIESKRKIKKSRDGFIDLFLKIQKNIRQRFWENEYM